MTSDKASESKRKLNLKKRKGRLSPLESNKQLATLPEDSADPTMSSRVMVPKGPITKKLTEIKRYLSSLLFQIRHFVYYENIVWKID